ncbi:MAG: NUDIX domain-containing protein [Bacilli bacterium]|jgi:predicted NUDIX family NTP pyrophosphohydrolase|nr:NUDIX domain-containing protein [Bacilli bacterium]
MKRSAGILVYRLKNNKAEVFLEHMGGPYWQKKDEGAWSIPKGEYIEEQAIEAAVREFKEETGFELKKESLDFLASIKQGSQKLVTAFVTCHDFDEKAIKSNMFKMEWPPKSGKMVEFPEMDCAEWFQINDAKKKILKGQIPFLEKLEEYLKNAR